VAHCNVSADSSDGGGGDWDDEWEELFGGGYVQVGELEEAG